ncbi:MAG: hypothetical protein Q6370_025910 [Candidatus Sigynarchaeota archaeon]
MERLIVGWEQYLEAEKGGNRRTIISNGYQALDNHFHAILLNKGIDPTFNHEEKLNLFIEHFSHILKAVSIDVAVLRKYIKIWKAMRYGKSCRILPNTDDALEYLRMTSFVCQAIRDEIAKDAGVDKDAIYDEIMTRIMGENWLGLYELDDHVLSKWEDERYNRLSLKLVNPAAFSRLSVTSEDPSIIDALQHDGSIRSALITMYNQFLVIIEKIRENLVGTGPSSPNDIDFARIANKSTAFLLSIAFCYHGKTGQRIAEEFEYMLKMLKSGQTEGRFPFFGK